jgi:lambda family phage tail tape measure protein
VNLDAILKITAQVAGANEIKTLGEGLQGVESSAKNASTGLQQAAQESSRAANESARAGAAARSQAVALQALRTGAQAGAAEMRRMGGEAKALGADFQRIKNQSTGAFDGLSGSAVKGAASIRKLQDFLQPAEAQLAKLRESVLQYGAANTQSERSINLQLTALKNLRSQAEINGSTFNALSSDIQRLTAITKAADIESSNNVNNLKRAAAAGQAHADSVSQQIQEQREFIELMRRGGGDIRQHTAELDKLKDRAVQIGLAWEPGIRGWKLFSKAAGESVAQQSRQVTLLQATLGEAGDAYRRVGREIDALRQKAASLDLSKGLQVTPGNVARGTVGAVQNIVAMRQDLARSMMGRVVLTGEGLAASGVAGAAGMGMASGLGGMAGGAQGLANSLDAIAAKAAAMPGVLKPLGGLLSEPAAAAANSVGQWSASLTAAQAKLTALSGPFEAIGNAISAIGPEASAAAGVASLAIAGVYQVLSRQADEAQADLEASFRGISDGAQKVLSDLVRIYDKVPNARLEAQQELRDRNLQRLGEVPSDSAEARRAANAVVSAEREINRIKGEQKALVQGVRDRLEAQQQLTAAVKATAEAERQAALAARAAYTPAFASARSLLLPAAGQSSFQGRVNALGMGGGARILSNYETAGTRDDIGQVMASRSDAVLRQQQDAAQRTRGALAELYLEIDRVTAASNGSIGSINQQRTAWAALQNAVNPAAPAFARAADQLKALDRQLDQIAASQKAAAAALEAGLLARARYTPAFAGAPARTLALPAAGQTSFQGAIDSRGFGGGARAAITAGGERPLIMGVDRTGRAAFGGASDYAGPQFGVASNATAQASQRTRGALAELFITIDRVTAASNGSVSSLQRQRSAWEALRVAVSPAAPAYARATAQVQQLDEKLAKLTATQRKQQDVQRQGIGREAIGSALGTLASGGGAQGAIGALAGGLAFSGGPAGIVAGAGVAAAGATLGSGVTNAMQLQQSQLRLKLLSEGFDSFNAVQKTAIDLGNKFNTIQADASNQFASSYARLRPLGFTLAEISDIYSGFNTAAKLSGTTASEAAGAWLQLSQALGSGALRGEELNSVYEQTPQVIREIAEVMDIPIGKIKDYAKQGKITSAIVLQALQNISKEGAGKLAASMEGPIEKTNALKKAWNELSVTVGTAAMPAFVGVLDVTTKIIQGINSVDWSVLAMGLGADPTPRGAKAPRLTGPKLKPYTVAGITYDPITGASISRDLSGERSRAAAARQVTADDAAKTAAKETRTSTSFQPSSKARALISAAGKLGVSPLDLATIISFETGGTFSPGKWGGSGNNYLGLIQMGGPERKKYGAHAGQSFEEQVQGPVVRYLQDRFKSRGMSTQGADLLTLYRTVLGGNPKASLTRTDGNKVTPASGVARMGPHRQKALRMFFGGSLENVGYDLAQAGADQVQGREETAALQKTRADQLAASRDLLATKQGLLRIAQATGPAEKLLAEFDAARTERMREYADRLRAALSDDERRALLSAQVADAGAAEIQYREGLKRITEEQLDLDRQRLENVFAMGDAIKEYQSRDSASAGLSQGMKQYGDSIGNVRDAIASLTVDGMGGLENSLVSLATTGSGNFNAFAASVLTDTSRMIFRQFVLKTIMTALGFLSPSAAAAPSMAQSFTGDFGGGISTGFPGAITSFNPVGPAPVGLPRFAGGGYTGNGPRSGGLDGRGGFMAMLHPRETVVDHAQGNSGTTSSTQVNIAVHVHPNGNVTSNSDGSGDAQALGNDLARMLVPMVGPMVDRQLQRHMERGGLLNR